MTLEWHLDRWVGFCWVTRRNKSTNRIPSLCSSLTINVSPSSSPGIESLLFGLPSPSGVFSGSTVHDYHAQHKLLTTHSRRPQYNVSWHHLSSLRSSTPKLLPSVWNVLFFHLYLLKFFLLHLSHETVSSTVAPWSPFSTQNSGCPGKFGMPEKSPRLGPVLPRGQSTASLCWGSDA